MFGNDLNLSSEESYHALANASDLRPASPRCAGQISVHGTWRPFFWPCGLLRCEEVCTLWTYLKNPEERKDGNTSN